MIFFFKAANIQRKTWKNLQKAQRAIAQDHLKNIPRKSDFFEEKYKEMRPEVTFSQYCVFVCVYDISAEIHMLVICVAW